MLAAAILQPGDYTGFTFFIVGMAMLASTVFFFVERGSVEGKWRLSVTVSALITGIAAAHYYYMRDIWAATGTSPTEIRYIDWILTVPLMCIEFYLILRAIQPVASSVLGRLFGGSIVMLIFGYLGEVELMNNAIGFWIGMAGWGLVMYEIYFGQASKISVEGANENVRSAFVVLRRFALWGWAIYPIGFWAGAAGGASLVDIVYNVADVVNKVGFGLVIYSLAKRETARVNAAAPAAAPAVA
jgi:bacteriorhodopsin